MLLAAVLFSTAWAQPCSIDLGADVTICQGQTTVLHGPPGMASYLWDTGETTADITTGVGGNHWCRVTNNTGNVIPNGDFSAGNTGFTSQFTYNSNLIPEPTYFIDTQTETHHNNFHASHNGGNFLMANAGASHNHYIVWSATANVCPGQTYTLNFDGCDISGTAPPQLDWYINGTLSSGPYNTPLGPGNWQTFSRTWTAGAAQTSATFSIRVRNPVSGGSDIGLDDITLSTTLTMSDTVRVIVATPPTLDLGPDLDLCTGQTHQLVATTPGSSYLWQNGHLGDTFTVNAPGTYSVTVTQGACTVSDAVNVTYHAPPSIDLGPDIALCNGNATVLDATTPGATYLWQNGSTNPTFLVLSSGHYTVDVTVGGCTTSDDIDVAINAPPTIDLGPNVALCQGQSTSFNVTVANGTYLWENGSTSPTRTVSTPGHYTVTVSANGCTTTDAVDVTVAPIPTVTLPADAVICQGQSLHLDATQPGATYHWQDGSTASTFDATATGTYTVDVTVNGCTGSDAIGVTVNTPPTVELGPDVDLCQGQSTPFDVTVPGGSYLWENGSTSPTRTVNSTGHYTVTVTANGCPTTDDVDVTVAPMPTVTLPADVTLCAGQTLHLDATYAGATYLWQDGSTNATFDVSAAGTYDVDVTLGQCTASDAIQVGYLPPNAVNLGPDVQLCQGQSTAFDVTIPGGTYLWENGSTSPTRTISAAGAYSVTVTVNGCDASDAVNVAVAPMPTVTLPADASLCAGQSIHLDATYPGATYLWQDGSTNATFDANATGTYSVDVTLGLCTASDAMDVIVHPAPTIELGPATTICAGTPLQLDATVAGATYLWQDGSTDATFDVIATDTYTVTVDLNGCTTSDSRQVTVQPLPAFDLGADRIVCPGAVATFNATTAGATYLWSDGSTAATLTTDVPGTYSVQVTVGQCTATDQVELDNFDLQSVDLGNDVVACAGTPIPLSVNVPGAAYAWSNGSTGNAVDATTAGWWWVDVTLNGCAVRDSVQVTINPLPTVDLGADVLVCTGATSILDATTPNATYLWNDNSTNATLDAGVGEWNVRVTVNGCSARDTVAIGERLPPALSLGPDTLLCPGTGLPLQVGPGLDALWTDGSTAIARTVTAAGTYAVTVTDAFGCTNTDAIVVSYATPIPVVLGTDTTICQGSRLVLDATTPGATSYAWNNGASGPTLDASGIGTYWVEVFQGRCSVTDTIHVEVVSGPSVQLPHDTTLCPGATLLLNANAGGTPHVWQDGSTGPQFLVDDAGLYWVRLTDVHSCVAADSIHVAYLDASGFELGNDTTLCSGTTLTLHAQLPGGTTTWSTGASGPSLTVSTAGTYTATIHVGACSVTDAITVGVVTAPTVDLGATDRVLCADADLLLSAQPINGANYLWDDNSTGTQRTVSGAGTYWARVTLNGCIASDTVHVTGVPLPVLALGNDTALCPGDTRTVDITTSGATYLWNDGSTSPTRTLGPGEWSVSVTADGCSSTDDLTITEAPLPTLDLPADTVLCPGITWTINVAEPGATYLWQNGSTSGTFPVNSAGTYTVAANLGGCLGLASVNVAYLDPTQLDLGPDTALCPGTSLTLSSPFVGADITWQDGSHGTTYHVQDPGVYRLLVDANGCSAQDSVHVTNVPLVIPDLGADQGLCEGNVLTLTVSPGDAAVRWSTGANTHSIDVTTAGTYSVMLTLDGCRSADTIAVAFDPMTTHVDLGADAELCPGHPLQLDASSVVGTYRWSTGDTGPMITVTMPGVYIVLVEGTCLHAIDTVVVATGECLPAIFVPNAFTPDGDGINDTFMPSVDGDILSYDLMIFDRWGMPVFHSTQRGQPWDGTLNGARVPDDVYVWRIEYKALGGHGLKQERLLGSVTLLR